MPPVQYSSPGLPRLSKQSRTVSVEVHLHDSPASGMQPASVEWQPAAEERRRFDCDKCPLHASSVTRSRLRCRAPASQDLTSGAQLETIPRMKTILLGLVLLASACGNSFGVCDPKSTPKEDACAAGIVPDTSAKVCKDSTGSAFICHNSLGYCVSTTAVASRMAAPSPTTAPTPTASTAATTASSVQRVTSAAAASPRAASCHSSSGGGST